MSDFAKDLVEMMNAYDSGRVKWIDAKGSAAGYDDWFAAQLVKLETA